jgi:protein MpaA
VRRVGALACAAGLAALVAGRAPAQPSDPGGHRSVVLGHSVQGRAITAVELGDLDSPRKVLVVGCIHGNEPAGIAIAAQLARSRPPSEVDLWIVPDLNPDGDAAGTRGNAHGVDLNRNFPWRWTSLTGVHYSGPRALSEPESRIAARLIAQVRPAVSIWFHQHLDVVDDSSGNVAIVRRFAAVAGLPLATLTRDPGSVVSWETHVLPSGTAFVVELPAGAVPHAAVGRFVRAVGAAAAAAPEARPAFRRTR